MKTLGSRIERILFVGLGGAGQRHLRIFKQLLSDQTQFLAYRSTHKTPALNPDFSVDHRTSLEEKYNLLKLPSLHEALKASPDVVVIATPTATHFEIAKRAAEARAHLFVEKPFSHALDGFEEFKSLVLKNELYYYVGYQRRFHPLLRKVKDLLNKQAIGRILSASFIVDSYLPAWHPYENFLDLYACRRELGGGVLLTEIHEIDLCYWYFGLPEMVTCVGGNYSGVAMDVEDTAHLTLKYDSLVAHVSLCFMQKHIRRELSMTGTHGYLSWNAADNVLRWKDYERNQEMTYTDQSFKNDDMFVAQTSYFLNDMTLAETTENLDTARASLMIVEAAKRSMQQGSGMALSAAGSH